MNLLLCLLLTVVLPGQTPQDRNAAGDTAKRLAIMKKSLASSEVRGGESGADSYRLKTEPVLRRERRTERRSPSLPASPLFLHSLRSWRARL